MKTEYYIAHANRDEMPKQAWKKLIALAPEGDMGLSFRGEFDESDPRTLQIIDLLQSSGLHPRERGKNDNDKNPNYLLHINRYYTPADLEPYELLEIQPKTWLKAALYFDKEDNGMFLLQPELFKNHRAGIASAGKSGCFVSDPIRKLMEKEKVKGAQFVAINLRDNYVRLPDGSTVHPKLSWKTRIPNGPWWRLISNVILPNVSPRVPLSDGNGQPLPVGSIENCYHFDGHFTKSELRYARSSLKKVAPFDLAFTREYWAGPPEDLHHRFVISKRFLDLAVKHKWKLEFRPVHIDEDL